MPVYPVLRKNELRVYVSDAELALFEEMAAKEGMKMSDYLRTAAIADACLGLNRRAWKVFLDGASRTARGYLERKRTISERLKSYL